MARGVRVWRRLVPVVVIALALGACGDDFEPSRDRDRTSQSSPVVVVVA